MDIEYSVTDNFIVFDSPNGYYTKFFEDSAVNNNVANEIFLYAARAICFDDCCDDRVEAIYVGGRKVEYMGWQPGMLYEFCDDRGRIVWSRRFPEWDH